MKKKKPVKIKANDHGGRPTSYSEEVGEKICDYIATSDLGLRKICDIYDVPPYLTITKWLLDDSHPFSKQYARAKEQQSEVLGDQIISIADDCVPDSKFAVEKAKLQVDARKFVAAKLKPKKWGDKIIQEHTGANGDAIKIDSKAMDLSVLSADELMLYRTLTEKVSSSVIDK